MGVLDERIDLHLLALVAELRPQWQLILIGPTAKIDPSTLPRGKNLHYLGGKPYADLPSYLAGWDVGLMPFALNDATRYISPTKTPEYLAAGLPVVSTPIRDVITPYGKRGLVRIASTATEFVDACEAALQEDSAGRRESAGDFLRDLSWDRTWDRMATLIDQAIAGRSASKPTPVGSVA
jgi:UDP-galactopyranose mutase